MWGMLENPSSTTLRIGRSEQKNYTHLLFALCGPLLFAVMLFAARIGDTSMPFGYMLFGITIFGPLLGLLFLITVASFLRIIIRLSNGVQVPYREAAAWFAWSLTPLIWVSVLVLPVFLGVFGLILFSTNPAPWIMLPLPFWMLSTLAVVALAWSILLLPLGYRVYGPSYRTLILQQAGVWLLLVAFIALGAELLRAIV